ncbi:hypothetical protein ABTY61_12015 [Kitasatospora sp. NPDC096128]|uniref:hypothetical protein n=1 Tax=Kitasatospora sp. NPDC096128 TaxID=3155547 RepID=UPI00331B13A8
MSNHRGRQADADERRERERAWSAGQQERERAWSAEFEQRQRDLEVEYRERHRVEATARERRAWAGGGRDGGIGCVDVTGPDDRRVRLALVWLGGFRATRKPLSDQLPLRNLGTPSDAVGLLLTVLVLTVLGLDFWLRWTVLTLLGRPRWAVAAAVGPHIGTAGNNLVLRRCRSRREALRYAAAVADDVERDGAAALTPR